MGFRERDDRAAEMPHRKWHTDPTDKRLECSLGVLFLQGIISEPEYQAGLSYGQVMTDYLQTVDAPAPYGNGFDDLPDGSRFQGRKLPVTSGNNVWRGLPSYRDSLAELSEDLCFRRKVRCSEKREILKRAAQIAGVPQSQVITAVDRVAVYGEDVRSERELRALHVGLKALAGGPQAPARRFLPSAAGAAL
jgi:hypothetical protein